MAFSSMGTLPPVGDWGSLDPNPNVFSAVPWGGGGEGVQVSGSVHSTHPGVRGLAPTCPIGPGTSQKLSLRSRAGPGQPMCLTLGCSEGMEVAYRNAWE